MCVFHPWAHALPLWRHIYIFSMHHLLVAKFFSSFAWHLVCVCTCIVTVIVTITGAVHRYYESRRQLFIDSQPERIEVARRTRQNSKNKALQKQVYTFAKS